MTDSVTPPTPDGQPTPERLASPIRPTDDEARKIARDLMDSARFAALGVINPETRDPMVSRIAIATTAKGAPVTLVSTLSAHSRALETHAGCSLLIGEPGPRGDPLTHPRLSLQARAVTVRPGAPLHGELRARYLGLRPKSGLYIDFADFYFVIFQVTAGFLNGGFGRAFNLTPGDLGLGSE